MNLVSKRYLIYIYILIHVIYLAQKKIAHTMNNISHLKIIRSIKDLLVRILILNYLVHTNTTL